MSRREQAIRDYGLFGAGIFTGLGVINEWWTAGAFAIIAVLLLLGLIRELRGVV